MNYRVSSDMVLWILCHRAPTSFLHVAANMQLLPLSLSLSARLAVPVAQLSLACLSGPAGCSVSVHGAGDNDFPRLAPAPPSPPPHLKLQR